MKPIGDADAGPARPVGLNVTDGRQHVHLTGATGSGKSELLARMILNDAEHRRGVMAIDPKGDLIPDILARLDEDAGVNAATLVDIGAGVGPAEPLDGASLRAAVDAAFAQTDRAHALRDDVRRNGGTDAAADAVERLCASM